MVASDAAFAYHVRLIWSFDMTTRSHLATAVMVMVMACLQAGPLLAQSAPAPDTAATPAPAASPAPSATPADKAGASDGNPASGKPAKPTKLRVQMSEHTRQQIDHSIKTRTVPSRYRSQVPKEYQKYIPFER